MKKILFLFSISVFLFSACKKDKKARPMDYVTNGVWYQKSAVVSGNVGGQPIYYDLLTLAPDCSKDDYRAFKRSGELIKNEGETKCNEEDPQEVNEGTWFLLENQTVLQMPVMGNPVNMTIVQADLDYMVLQWSQVIGGIPVSVTTTYSH